MMTLQDYRDYVRGIFDLEVTDLPDTLIDRWVVEGCRRINRVTARWRYLETKQTLTLVAGQAEYVVSGFDRIDSVVGQWGNLGWVEGADAQARFARVGTGDYPRHWSEWDGILTLWPTPASAGTVQLFGYRAMTEWWEAGSGATPDFPAALESVLLSWVMFRAYTWDGDDVMSASERREFEAGLAEMETVLNEATQAQPLVVGRHATRRRYVFPYEQPYSWDVIP